MAGRQPAPIMRLRVWVWEGKRAEMSYSRRHRGYRTTSARTLDGAARIRTGRQREVQPRRAQTRLSRCPPIDVCFGNMPGAAIFQGPGKSTRQKLLRVALFETSEHPVERFLVLVLMFPVAEIGNEKFSDFPSRVRPCIRIGQLPMTYP